MSEEKTSTRLTGAQLMQLVAQEKQKAEELTQRINSFQSFKSELRAAKDALSEIEKSKKGEKILVNLGAGIYVEASIEENTQAISSLSGKIFKTKKIKDLDKTIENKIKNLDKTIATVAEEQSKAVSRLNQLESVIAAGRQHMAEQAAKKN